jgi:hypothetical protein
MRAGAFALGESGPEVMCAYSLPSYSIAPKDFSAPGSCRELKVLLVPAARRLIGCFRASIRVRSSCTVDIRTDPQQE